jgi:hypothetical protein
VAGSVLIAWPGAPGVVEGPVVGWPQAGPRAVLTVWSRAGSLPMSCRYADQLRPAPDSWVPSVGTAAG